MKEKERYEVIYNEDELGYCIIDNEEDLSDGMHSFNIIADLLNQQDKRIKELELRLETKEIINNLYKATVSLRDGDFKDLVYENNKLKQENQQLKEENGYIIFVDGYDNNNNEIHRQEFIKYKDKCSELLEENKRLKQSQKQLAINELLKLKSYFVEECLDGDDITTGDTIFTKDAVEIALQISNQIKELKDDTK